MKDGYTLNPLDRSSYKPIYIQLSEMIIEYARNKDLKHGDLLPSENELLAELDVSRNTIRLAVDRLVKMGFATKVRGQGTFLKEQKKSHAVLHNVTQGFEESFKRLGIKVENKLIEKINLSGPVDWGNGLTGVNSEKTVLIRRLKLDSGTPLALEERILPLHVAQRYSEQEFETESICPDLLGRYPDTQIEQLKYVFVSQPLNKDEKKLLNIKTQDAFLQRMGEYFNPLDECFMISRLIIASDRVNLSYAYKKQDNDWILTS